MPKIIKLMLTRTDTWYPEYEVPDHIKDEDIYEKAKSKQVTAWKKVFDELCNYGSYPAAATASAQTFSIYMRQQLSFVDQDVVNRVVKEREVGSIDELLQGVAEEISKSINKVATTYQPTTLSGRPAGVVIKKPSQQLKRERNAAAKQAMERSFTGFLQRLFEGVKEKYNKTMDERREELMPLLTMQTKIQVKKIYTDAFHNGDRYEIVLVDENAKPAGNSGQGKQNAVTLD